MHDDGVHPTAGSRLDVISFHEFVSAYQALAFANCQGLIVDTPLDVTWSLHGRKTAAEVSKLLHHLLAGIEGWLAEEGVPPLYLWVLEEGARFGIHSHITLHVPKGRAAPFHAAVRKMLENLVGGALVEGEGASTMFTESFDSETTGHQWRRFTYMLKGTDPMVNLRGTTATREEQTLVRAAGINYSFQGFIDVPRIGWSRYLADVQRWRWSTHIPLPKMEIDPLHPPRFNDRYLDWHDTHAQSLQDLGLLWTSPGLK